MNLIDYEKEMEKAGRVDDPTFHGTVELARLRAALDIAHSNALIAQATTHYI